MCSLWLRKQKLEGPQPDLFTHQETGKPGDSDSPNVYRVPPRGRRQRRARPCHGHGLQGPSDRRPQSRGGLGKATCPGPGLESASKNKALGGGEPPDTQVGGGGGDSPSRPSRPTPWHPQIPSESTTPLWPPLLCDALCGSWVPGSQAGWLTIPLGRKYLLPRPEHRPAGPLGPDEPPSPPTQGRLQTRRDQHFLRVQPKAEHPCQSSGGTWGRPRPSHESTGPQRRDPGVLCGLRPALGLQVRALPPPTGWGALRLCRSVCAARRPRVGWGLPPTTMAVPLSLRLAFPVGMGLCGARALSHLPCPWPWPWPAGPAGMPGPWDMPSPRRGSGTGPSKPETSS